VLLVWQVGSVLDGVVRPQYSTCDTTHNEPNQTTEHKLCHFNAMITTAKHRQGIGLDSSRSSGGACVIVDGVE
jgi:hypothetical protein